MATCPRQKCVPRQMTTVLRWCSDLGARSKVLRPMGSAASSRSLGEHKIDVAWQRLWHRRVLDDIEEIGIVERANGTVQAHLRSENSRTNTRHVDPDTRADGMFNSLEERHPDEVTQNTSALQEGSSPSAPDWPQRRRECQYSSASQEGTPPGPRLPGATDKCPCTQPWCPESSLFSTSRCLGRGPSEHCR